MQNNNMEYLCILLIGCSLFSTAISSSNEYKTLEWIEKRRFDEDKQHEKAGVSGNFPIYVARVAHESGNLIGRYDTSTRKVHFLHNSGSRVQILVYPKGSVAWTLRQHGRTTTLPANIIVAGVDPFDMEQLFICRTAVADGKIYPGTFKASEANLGCFVEFDGKKTYVDTDYELLSLSLLGIAMEAGGS